MIFENEDEKIAFEFVCELASEATDKVCNDLEPETYKKFRHLKVESEDIDGAKIMRVITYDFDILHWLKTQAKK